MKSYIANKLILAIFPLVTIVFGTFVGIGFYDQLRAIQEAEKATQTKIESNVNELLAADLDKLKLATQSIALNQAVAKLYNDQDRAGLYAVLNLFLISIKQMA